MHQAQVLELGKLKGNLAWAGDYMACDLVPVGPADDRSLGKMVLSGTFRADRGAEPIATYKVTRARHCR